MGFEEEEACPHTGKPMDRGQASRYLLAPMAGLAGDLRELSFFEVFEDFAIDFLRHGDHEARDVFAGIFV